MTQARKDADNLKILERLKPEFDQLKTMRIRTEAEVERHSQEYDAAKAQAREALGTDEEAEIRRLIEAGREENTREVDAFVAAIEDVKRRIAEIEQESA